MINIVYPESHDHLGLLDDIAEIQDVNLMPVKRKEIKNSLLRKVRKIHLSSTLNRYVHFPFKDKWFQMESLNLSDDKNAIVIFDGALKHFTPKRLNDLLARKNLIGILVLINSIRASSASMGDIKKIIPKVNWTHVWTFDSIDAQDFGYEYLGCCYYSKHLEDEIQKKYPSNVISDIYFAGGIKGERWKLILSIYNYLRKNEIKPNFKINVTGKAKYESHPYINQIHYYSHEWFPYGQILSETLNSNVILEILQKGQNGPSLRYYEAVCYNKKLITNNKNAVDLPYYNSEYMKIISIPEEIDLTWVKKHDEVQYNYRGDFSPIYLVERVRKMME